MEKFLNGVWKVKPSKFYIENSSRRVFHHVKSEPWCFFVTKFLRTISQIEVSNYMKTSVKTRLLAFVNRRTFKEGVEEFLVSVFLKWLLIPTMIASFFFVFIIWVNTTSAEIESRVILVKWDAQIKHLWWQWEDISSNEILSIWDTIKTSIDSLVEIYYYDNSVTRISENSIISVSSLSSNPYRNLPTILSVESWNIWNQVISSEYDFQVDTWDTFTSTKKWVFYVKKDKITKIAAISQPLSVRIISNNNLSFSKKIAAWFWISTSEYNSDNTSLSTLEPSKIMKDEWEIKNRLADAVYKEKLINKINSNAIKDVSILPNNKLYFAKKELENITNKKSIDVIKKRLQELKVITINNIKNLAKENISVIEKLKVNLTKEENIELVVFLKKEINKLDIVLPQDKLYQYKLYVSDLLIEIDDTWSYNNQISLNRINEAQEIAWSTKNNNDLLVALNHFIQAKPETDEEDWVNELRKSLAYKNDLLFALQSLEGSLEKSSDVVKIVRREKIKVAHDIKQIIKEVSPTPVSELWASLNDSYYYANQIHNFLKRVNTYGSERSRENTLYWILEELPCDKNNLELLYSLREKVEGWLSTIVSKAILKTMRCD